MKKNPILPWALLAASVIMSVVSYLILPETVVTQFSVGSTGVTTMPKLIALLIPLVLGAGGAVAAMLGKGDDKAWGKSLLVSVIGVAVFIIMLAVNL